MHNSKKRDAIASRFRVSKNPQTGKNKLPDLEVLFLKAIVSAKVFVYVWSLKSLVQQGFCLTAQLGPYRTICTPTEPICLSLALL